MKFVVVGAGALGSIIAAHLSRAGEDVALIARGKRAAYLQEQGITITGLAEFNSSCLVTTDAREVSGADYLILAVKTYHMVSALADVRHLEVSSVLSVQNGVLKNEQLADVFGEDRTLGAAALFSGEVNTDGSVRFSANQGFYIGELPGGTSKRVDFIVEALDRSGIQANACRNIRRLEWSKFAAWVSNLALSVLLRLELYKILSDPESATIGARIIREVASLAERFGVEVEDVSPWPVGSVVAASEAGAVKIWRDVGPWLESRSLTHKASSLQDLERGRPLEVEETLGFLVAKAKDESVPVPTVETCYCIISALNKNSR